MRALALIPVALAGCVAGGNPDFPPLATPSGTRTAPASTEPTGFSPVPGVVLSQQEEAVYKRLTPAQQGVVNAYLSSGSTLASALLDERIAGADAK